MTWSSRNPWHVFYFSNLGVFDKEVHEFAKYNDKRGSNAHRALSALIHKKGRTLAVALSAVDALVKIPRKRKQVVQSWPVIFFSSWIRACFENDRYGGYFLLGGQKLDCWEHAQRMLGDFWSRYRKMEPDLFPSHPQQTLPIFLHGDEGRGLGKRPLLVISFQPVIGITGGENTNSSGHLSQTFV